MDLAHIFIPVGTFGPQKHRSTRSHTHSLSLSFTHTPSLAYGWRVALSLTNVTVVRGPQGWPVSSASAQPAGHISAVADTKSSTDRSTCPATPLYQGPLEEKPSGEREGWHSNTHPAPWCALLPHPLCPTLGC